MTYFILSTLKVQKNRTQLRQSQLYAYIAWQIGLFTRGPKPRELFFFLYHRCHNEVVKNEKE